MCNSVGMPFPSVSASGAASFAGSAVAGASFQVKAGGAVATPHFAQGGQGDEPVLSIRIGLPGGEEVLNITGRAHSRPAANLGDGDAVDDGPSTGSGQVVSCSSFIIYHSSFIISVRCIGNWHTAPCSGRAPPEGQSPRARSRPRSRSRTSPSGSCRCAGNSSRRRPPAPC